MIRTLALAAALLAAPDYAADASVLQQVYQALHPGLYRYNTPAQIDAGFALLQARLAQAHSVGEAFLDFTEFTALLRCGHSYPNFYNQPADVARVTFGGRNRVPFYFEWIERKMIVTKNFSGDARLLPGSEVTSIDGVAAGSILDRLLLLARADGSNDAKRIDQLAVRGTDRYEAFDIYYPLAFPHASAIVHAAIRPLHGPPLTLTLRALTQDERIAAIPPALIAKGSAQPVWSLAFIRSAVGYLRMPTWEVYDSKWDWQHAIDDEFRSLESRHARTLIVDLRGNEGGSDVGNAILAHLIDEPLHLRTYRRLVRYRSVPTALRPYLDTWDPSFFDWGNKAIPLDERFYRLTAYDDDAEGDVIQPALPRFSGTVMVLVDAANSSATFQFDDVMQRNHLGLLIGTPTGGNQRGINGGAFFFVRLPRSHIEVDLPLIGMFPAQAMPDAGLTPDVVVTRSPESIARGEDPQLAAALARSGE